LKLLSILEPTREIFHHGLPALNVNILEQMHVIIEVAEKAAFTAIAKPQPVPIHKQARHFWVN